MINFIKKAVESVEGIKSFLFNTDYRNNFSLGNVDYPCCVLTPLMNTKYDLNNFIHESAELQISIIDTAPYEYTGDDLYSINKRCSDLLLQVIANLQVKTKFNKEVTFEFILPSGDELVSGVMCNITATMKQGSCIGAPSYVEVVVQPIVRKSITTNGTYHIIPSKGFNAMREVEVDVRIEEKAGPILQSKAILIKTNNSNVNIVADEGFDGLGNISVDVQIPTEERSVDITRNGEVEILPTSADAMTKVTANVQVPPPPLEEKQVTITRNGTTEIVPTSEYGLSRVEVVAEVVPNLQDKQVSITENGTQIITADEGFDGLSSVEVNANVHGTGFSVLGGGEFQEEFNSLIAQKVTASNLASSQAEGNITYKFRDNTDIIYVVSDKEVQGQSAFSGCTELIWLKLNIGSVGLKWGISAGNNIRNLDFTFSRNIAIGGLLMNLTKAKKITINGRSDMLIFDMEGKVDIGDFMRGSSAINVPVIIPNGVTGTFMAFNQCSKIPYIDLGEVSVGSFSNNVFSGCSSLATLKFTKWGKNNIPLNMTSVLTAESIHYIIQNAMSVADGATARTLTLHATVKTNWQNSEYYEQDLAVLTDKGITIA